MFARRNRFSVVLAGLTVAAMLAPADTLAQGGRDAKQAKLDAESIRAENARLQKLLTLARGEKFYLLVEPGQQRLQLMYAGTVLREFTVLDVTVGRRKTLFIERTVPANWREMIWEGSELEPKRDLRRLEIIPATPGTAADSLATMIPPTPEEAIPAPNRFLVHYRDRLSLEVVGQDQGKDSVGPHRGKPTTRTPRAGIHDRLWPWGRDLLRLRLLLPAEEAKDLYRAFPEGSQLLISE